MIELLIILVLAALVLIYHKQNADAYREGVPGAQVPDQIQQEEAVLVGLSRKQSLEAAKDRPIEHDRAKYKRSKRSKGSNNESKSRRKGSRRSKKGSNRSSRRRKRGSKHKVGAEPEKLGDSLEAHIRPVMGAELGNTVTKLAISLLKQIISDDENVFFSPTSLAIALSMTLAGADGNTREQMLKTLQCGKDEAATHRAFEELVKAMKTPMQSGSLYVANRLYSMSNIHTARKFVNTLSGRYCSEFKQVDFTDDAVRDEINQWAADVTMQRITELIPDGLLGETTRIVILNAIYFKGNWLDTFHDRLTRKAYFYVSASEKIKVKMMNHESPMRFLYTEDETYQAIQLPYREDFLCMVILLPKETDGLLDIVRELTEHAFLNIISNMKSRLVKVYLPKFRVETAYNLPTQLKKLGMVDMFSSLKANFSRITKNSAGLHVSHVIHKAFVEVNERGTEAAAATAVIMALRGSMRRRRPKPITFRADHPFIFSIFDRRFGCPLFYGTLVRPKQ